MLSNIQRNTAVCGLLALGLLTVGAGAAAAGDLAVAVRDSDGQPVADAVVTVFSTDGGATMLAPSPDHPYQIDQKDTAYHPKVSVIPRGGRMMFTNSDRWGHHVYSFSKAKRFDITVPAHKTSAPVSFEEAGVVVVGCNIHDRMLAYIYVSGEGLPVKSDKSGIARFLDLPSGNYRVTAWHAMLRSKRERPGTEVAIGGAETTETTMTLDLKQPGKSKRRKSRY